MNIYTLTAIVLCAVIVPVVAGTVSVIRQDMAHSRHDERWLSRHR